MFVQLLVARVPGFVTSVTTAFRGLTAAIYGTNVAANVASSGGLARLALLGGKFALAAATLASTFVVLEKATKLFQPDEFFDQERSKQLFPSSDTERDTIYTEINKKLDELKKTNQINEKAKAEIQKKIETDKKLLNAIKENNKKSVEALTANYRPLEPTLQIIKDRSKVLEMIAKLIKMDETTSFDVKDKENLKVNITAALKEFGINNNNITKAISAFIEDQNPANKKSLLTALVEITDQQKSKIGETIKLQEEIIKKFDNLSTDVPATPVTEVSTEVAKALQLIDEATATAAKEKATAIRNAEKQIIQIEQNAINELKKINIDAADSIAKYKKENIEKLANFTIQKEREIQEAKKQIQKNDLNILRNQQDYESSMQMISRRLKGFSTIDLEYEYKLRRLLEDKNQSLEDIRYTRIKDVKDLEQEIINIRKEGEKEVYNIWYDLYTRRTQIINDANAGRLQVGQDLRYSLQEIDRNKNERIIESLQSQNQQSSNILTLDDTFYKPPDITKLLQLAGLNRSQFEMYRQVLGARESGGIEKPYEAVNQFGYMGAYQIGRDVYNDAMVFAKQNKIHTEGINPEIHKMQDIYQEKLLLLVYNVYKQQLSEYIKGFQNFPIQRQMQLILAAHGHGAGDVANYLKGGSVPPDGNKVTIQRTMDLGQQFQQQAQIPAAPIPQLPVPQPPPINGSPLTNIVPPNFTGAPTIVPDMPEALKRLGDQQVQPFIEIIKKQITAINELNESEQKLAVSESLQNFSAFATEAVEPITQITENFYRQQRFLDEQNRLLSQGIKPALVEQTATLTLQQESNRQRLNTILSINNKIKEELDLETKKLTTQIKDLEANKQRSEDQTIQLTQLHPHQPSVLLLLLVLHLQ